MPRPATASGPLPPADEFRWVTADFRALVVATPPERWDDPAPVPGWVARDVVRHLVEWFPDFLANATGVTLERGPSVDDDPVAAWEVPMASIQALLDDPETAARPVGDPHTGEMPLAAWVDQFFTADVFMHTWDLARATGQPSTLDPGKCTEMFDGMQEWDERLRSSGHYGPRVEVPDDADPTTRLMGFIGRDPR